ncbi:MAG: hypothetical protein HY289_03595, partial [Planctomycetes bacterium]|nr:hypothetical protein [Planctomycetota bacterium]
QPMMMQQPMMIQGGGMQQPMMQGAGLQNALMQFAGRDGKIDADAVLAAVQAINAKAAANPQPDLQIPNAIDPNVQKKTAVGQGLNPLFRNLAAAQ